MLYLLIIYLLQRVNSRWWPTSLTIGASHQGVSVLSKLSPWYSQFLNSFFSNVRNFGNPTFSDARGLWRYVGVINKLWPLWFEHYQAGRQKYFTQNSILRVQIIPPFTISRSNSTQIVIGLISTFPTMATTLSMDHLPPIPRILLYSKRRGTHFVPAWISRSRSLLWVLTSTKPRRRCSSPSSSVVLRIRGNTH